MLLLYYVQVYCSGVLYAELELMSLLTAEHASQIQKMCSESQDNRVRVKTTEEDSFIRKYSDAQ